MPSSEAAAPDAATLERAGELLRRGGLVAFPTETVYGLGADARAAAAVSRVFAVKGRPADNPLIVHVADLAEVAGVALDITPLARELARRWWPGPLTLVLDARPEVPSVTTGGLSTVAVRVPDHPVALALLRAARVPVAAPSANRSGRPSPTTARHVVDDLGDAVDLVLDGGACGIGVESTVVDARGERPIVLREGAVTREALASVTPPAVPAAADLAASPGTRHRHYRPTCDVDIAPPGGLGDVVEAHLRRGRSVAGLGTTRVPLGALDLGPVAGARALAHRLYDALRAAEAADVDVIVVEAVAEAGLGRAVMDRLRRAAAG